MTTTPQPIGWTKVAGLNWRGFGFGKRGQGQEPKR